MQNIDRDGSVSWRLGAALLVALALALTGCGKDKNEGSGGAAKKARTGPAGALLDTMESFKDDMCKCTDAPCVEKVEGAMLEWMLENVDKFKDTKPNKEEDLEADQLQAEMEECKKKAGG